MNLDEIIGEQRFSNKELMSMILLTCYTPGSISNKKEEKFDFKKQEESDRLRDYQREQLVKDKRNFFYEI